MSFPTNPRHGQALNSQKLILPTMPLLLLLLYCKCFFQWFRSIYILESTQQIFQKPQFSNKSQSGNTLIVVVVFVVGVLVEALLESVLSLKPIQKQL